MNTLPTKQECEASGFAVLPELCSKPAVMEPEDEVKALASELRRRTSERDALAARLRQSPDMRAIVGELRAILATDGACGIAGERLRDLLRRLDESPNQGEQ